MKTKKIIISAILVPFISINTLFAANLEKINVVNNWTISIETSSDILLKEGEVSGDIKVLKDYSVSFAYKDPQDSKKIFLNLEESLEKNKSYNIIWIDWVESNANFSIWNELAGTYENNEKTKNEFVIEKISVTDDKTLELFYNKEIKAEEFVFKVLSEIESKSKIWDWKNNLTISLNLPLKSSWKYIVLANSLNDSKDKEVLLKESFYEFETWKNLENIFPDLELTEDKAEEKKEEGNIEEVAMNSAKTPETWAATWILVLLTIIIVWVFFISTKRA